LSANRSCSCDSWKGSTGGWNGHSSPDCRIARPDAERPVYSAAVCEFKYLAHIEANLLHRLITPLPVLCKSTLDDAGQCRRALWRRYGRRLFASDSEGHKTVIPCAKRPMPRDEFIAKDPKRKYLREGVRLRTIEQLRRHVVNGPYKCPRLSEPSALCQARNAKVHDLHAAVWQQHNVGGLDVVMNDSETMCEVNTLRQLRHASDLLRQGEASVINLCF
jgi:hypothetical protein